ncbi:hypothetical protein KGI01_20250 [Kurthia gibsonii]|nr:hypothetical protein KGI01_20250 [Kurthia gibsonii]
MRKHKNLTYIMIICATLFLGKKKLYTKIAIRSDDARQLQEIIEQRMNGVNQSR